MPGRGTDRAREDTLPKSLASRLFADLLLPNGRRSGRNPFDAGFFSFRANFSPPGGYV